MELLELVEQVFAGTPLQVMFFLLVRGTVFRMSLLMVCFTDMLLLSTIRRSFMPLMAQSMLAGMCTARLRCAAARMIDLGMRVFVVASVRAVMRTDMVVRMEVTASVGLLRVMHLAMMTVPVVDGLLVLLGVMHVLRMSSVMGPVGMRTLVMLVPLRFLTDFRSNLNNYTSTMASVTPHKSVFPATNDLLSQRFVLSQRAR